MSVRKNIYEKIEDWFFNGEFDIENKLSDDDYKVFVRWKFANNLLYQRRPVISTRQVVSALIKHFGVSERTADSDIANAKKLFGEARKINKDWENPFLREWLLEIASQAEAASDFRSAVAALKEAAKLTQLIADAEGSSSVNVPTTLNINFMLGEGQTKLINIDALQTLNKTDLQTITETVNAGSLPVNEMEELLDRYHGDSENNTE